MIDEGKKLLDREIPEDSLEVFGLVSEKCYRKKLYLNQFFFLLCNTTAIHTNFWNNQSSLITQGSEKLCFLEKKEYIASFITTSTGFSGLPGFQTIPFK